MLRHDRMFSHVIRAAYTSVLVTRITSRYEIFVYTNYTTSFHVSELETIKADMNSSLRSVHVCSVSR